MAMPIPLTGRNQNGLSCNRMNLSRKSKPYCRSRWEGSMSRTYRKELTRDTYNPRYVLRRLRNESLVRDGRNSIFTAVRRDNRSAGLREHKQYRARTRAELKGGNNGAVLSGKKRRYGDRHGSYEL